jgi:hypothetical protein
MLCANAQRERRAERRASLDEKASARDGAKRRENDTGGVVVGGVGGVGVVGGVGGLASDNSGDSTASEEGRLKRHASSPECALVELEKAGSSALGRSASGGGASGGSGKRKASSAAGLASQASGSKRDGGDASESKKPNSGTRASAGAASKPKPQPRSTQQWRAAEQRGRRLAIKPHTAVGVVGVGGAHAHGPGVGYYHPGLTQGAPGMVASTGASNAATRQMTGANGQAVLGQTRTVMVNGQNLRVWVPLTAEAGHGAAGFHGHHPDAFASCRGSPSREDGGGDASAKAPRFDDVSAASMHHQPQYYHPHAAGHVYQHHGQMGGGMVLVHQGNGQQIWVPASSGGFHPSAAAGPGAGPPFHGGLGYSEVPLVSGLDSGNGSGAPHVRGSGNDIPRGLGLGLKRNAGSRVIGERPGCLEEARLGSFDGCALEGGPMDGQMFRDAEMLEEDALDAILAQARDGTLLSFDGMDEAMLEAAACGDDGGVVGA